MPDNKERKVIKYGDASAEPEGKAAEQPAEPVAREEADTPDVPVPDYFGETGADGSAGRAEERRRRLRVNQTGKKRLTILIMVLVFALLATMCGKDIVRLKAENVALKRQQAALKKERDELKAELESTGEQEYIRDQARKQLRLLNPGELLFVWDE